MNGGAGTSYARGEGQRGAFFGGELRRGAAGMDAGEKANKSTGGRTTRFGGKTGERGIGTPSCRLSELVFAIYARMLR